MVPFRKAAREAVQAADDGDENINNTVLELYQWNAQMAAAALEQLAYLEVLLRHAVDTQLAAKMGEEERKIPWFLLAEFKSEQSYTIEEVRSRLRKHGKETRDQIVAGLSFGFWSGWFGPKHEDLWRSALHKAFPNGSGRRKDISIKVEQIRKFRNRVAHHDSLLNVDIGFEMQAIFELAEMINEDVAQWMREVDRTTEVGARKPINCRDTVVVPATQAWDFYERNYAYICQAGRFFQEVKNIAFYKDKEIQQEIPAILNHYDNVDWNPQEVKRLLASSDKNNRKLGKVMENGLASHWMHGKYQVFILSRPGDSRHVTLAKNIANDREGTSSAYVRKQRYTSVHQLRHAETVWEL